MCGSYHMWVSWWWKRYRATFPQQSANLKMTNGIPFRYEHPDIVREYHKKSPCDTCYAAGACDTPCSLYLAWYDCRMDAAKKKYGAGFGLTLHREGSL